MNRKVLWLCSGFLGLLGGMLLGGYIMYERYAPTTKTPAEINTERIEELDHWVRTWKRAHENKALDLEDQLQDQYTEAMELNRTNSHRIAVLGDGFLALNEANEQRICDHTNLVKRVTDSGVAIKEVQGLFHELNKANQQRIADYSNVVTRVATTEKVGKDLTKIMVEHKRNIEAAIGHLNVVTRMVRESRFGRKRWEQYTREEAQRQQKR